MTFQQFTEFVENATIVMALAFSLAAVASGLYVTWIYRHRHEEAPFLTRLVRRNQRVALAATVILVYLALALSDFGLGRPWGAVIIGGAVCLLLVGVIDDAVTWYRERRAFGKR